MSQLAYCNEGCNNQFYVDFKTDKLPGNVEKTYFNCTHCNHEYVAFYTDLETRKLQEKMRKLQKQFTNPNEDFSKLNKQEKKLQKLIKASMDKLRNRIES